LTDEPKFDNQLTFLFLFIACQLGEMFNAPRSKFW